MTRIFLSVVLALEMASVASARPSTLRMTCEQAQDMVESRGAVVLSTGAHTYDRFVSDPGYCATAEWAYSATAPTRDKRACRVGYVCKTEPPLWWDRPGDHWFFDR